MKYSPFSQICDFVVSTTWENTELHWQRQFQLLAQHTLALMFLWSHSKPDQGTDPTESYSGADFNFVFENT